MKAVITGPRSGLTEDLKLPHMHIEVDLEELPKPGEVIIVNSGSSYYVKYVMWWIDGPENEAYWSRTQDYDVQGSYQIAHIVVDTDNRRERWGYPAGVEDGRKQGGEEFLAELRKLVDLASSAGAGLKLIDVWLEKREVEAAERKEAEEQAERRADELLATVSMAASKRRNPPSDETTGQEQDQCPS